MAGLQLPLDGGSGGGRLAALTGDKAGAIAAYQMYLRFRSNPEPSLVPERERVEAELAKLLGEPR